ncbi:Chromosome segregation in meiosis protein 3 [Phytophthora cactorum]|nr:Chromosome segregation in meiosis protein 3 [Phytophthora cactorum]
MYKQWAFDLYPGLNFEDFVERTETLGKGHQVQGLMTELREKEKIKAVKKREEEEEKEKEESDSESEEAML